MPTNEEYMQIPEHRKIDSSSQDYFQLPNSPIKKLMNLSESLDTRWATLSTMEHF